MNISVFGTGYVGLVAGACLAEVGHQVTCMDINPSRIEQLRAGGMPHFRTWLRRADQTESGCGSLELHH